MKKKRIGIGVLIILLAGGLFYAVFPRQTKRSEDSMEDLTFTNKIQIMEEGLSYVRYEGDDGFTTFLDRSGASSDQEVAEFLMEELSDEGVSLLFGGNPFGCSTLSVASQEGGYLFGRNFDWQPSEAMVVQSKPENGYASVSTVNLDFITSNGIDLDSLPDRIQALIALYAPLDGMNEEGLAVSVNMIQDDHTIEQESNRPDLTTTTAIRLLLNQAANVEEAIDLLSQYDVHGSMGMMVHFAIADAQGRSVVVEYIENEMQVVETPVVTNFYLSEGDLHGVGTQQSHERYEILMDAIDQNDTMDEQELRDQLDRVSKDNFPGEYASTEWSIVMNQQTKELTYYHRENYRQGYRMRVE